MQGKVEKNHKHSIRSSEHPIMFSATPKQMIQTLFSTSRHCWQNPSYLPAGPWTSHTHMVSPVPPNLSINACTQDGPAGKTIRSNSREMDKIHVQPFPLWIPVPYTTARVLPINFIGMWVEYIYQLSMSRDTIPNYSLLTIFCNQLQESSCTVSLAVLALAMAFKPCIIGRLAMRQQCQWEVRPVPMESL